LAKPNPNGGGDIVATLTDVNESLVNALVQRIAKQQVEVAAADAELSKQVAAEQAGDLLGAALAANEEHALLAKAA
jgi:RNA 3'-terminal phosphate cyclase